MLVGRDLTFLCSLLGLSVGTGGPGSPFPSPLLAEKVLSKE